MSELAGLMAERAWNTPLIHSLKARESAPSRATPGPGIGEGSSTDTLIFYLSTVCSNEISGFTKFRWLYRFIEMDLSKIKSTIYWILFHSGMDSVAVTTGACKLPLPVNQTNQRHE